MSSKLYRSSENRKLCGVCGGIGEHFNIDANIIRIIWIIITIFNFPLGIILYIACVFLLPKNETAEESETYEEEFDEDIDEEDDYEDKTE